MNRPSARDIRLVITVWLMAARTFIPKRKHS